MFASQYHRLKAARVETVYDGVGVEGGRIEDRWILVAQTPFAVREGIHSEMEEGCELPLMPAKLARRRNRTIGHRSGQRRRRGQGSL